MSTACESVTGELALDALEAVRQQITDSFGRKHVSIDVSLLHAIEEGLTEALDEVAQLRDDLDDKTAEAFALRDTCAELDAELALKAVA